MKEFFDVVVWIGFIYILFIFIRGMNESQVEKHKNKLDEKKNNNSLEE